MVPAEYQSFSRTVTVGCVNFNPVWGDKKATFPRFNHIYAEAGAKEELISATLSFDKLHRWQSVFPMREWRAGRQAHASRLIAEEFALLANGATDPTASERSNGA